MSGACQDERPSPREAPEACVHLVGGHPDLRQRLIRSLGEVGLTAPVGPREGEPPGPPPLVVQVVLCADDVAAVREARKAAGSRVPLLALVPTSARRVAALEAGADDAVERGAPVSEIAARVRRLAEGIRMRRRGQEQNHTLMLLVSSIRRLARAGEIRELLRDQIASFGAGLGLDRLELLARVGPTGGEEVEHIAWAPGSGRLTALEGSPLPPEALRQCLEAGEPRQLPETPDGRGGAEILLLPLVHREERLGALAAVAPPGSVLAEHDEDTLHTLTDVLAGALHTARREGRLQARSERLEEVVHERTGELEQQQRLLQGIVETLPISVHLIDRDFRILAWNRGRETGHLGRPRGQVLGRSLLEALPLPDPGKLREKYLRVFAGEELPPEEVRSGSLEGARRYEVRLLPMRLEGREVTHVVTLARDVTVERRMQNRMAEAEKLAAAGRLAAGVAHEINNPLATMAACAEALAARIGGAGHRPDESELEEWKQDLKVIESEAYRCKTITGALLESYRGHQTEIRRDDRVDLGLVVDRTLKLMEHSPGYRRVILETVNGEEAPAVLGNEDELVQILLALVHNAVDASPEGGRVRIGKGSAESGWALLWVDDQGPGVPEPVRSRIFEPFFTTKPPGKGTGLGLSVAYGIARAHGGEIRLASAPDRGSRFEVALPPAESAGEVQA